MRWNAYVEGSKQDTKADMGMLSMEGGRNSNPTPKNNIRKPIHLIRLRNMQLLFQPHYSYFIIAMMVYHKFACHYMRMACYKLFS